MDRDELESWYRASYPDDPDVYNDHWLNTGYDVGLMDWVADVFEALQDIRVRKLLSGASEYALRRFARAFDKGVTDRPVIVHGTAHRARYLGDGNEPEF